VTGGGRPNERGREVYNTRCYFCHGYDGDGKTVAASFMTPKPRDFTKADPSQLSPARMEQAIRHGRKGTAMQPFDGLLDDADVAAVIAFVRSEFMLGKRENTRYHTPANGWIDHDRYRSAFPFVRAELSLNTPVETLTVEQRAGRDLYLATCVGCHEQGLAGTDAVAWESRPLSYPRNGVTPSTPVDAVTAASPYSRHNSPPKVSALNALARRGEALFAANCAFCHGRDGTGRNWIGRFVEPHAADLACNSKIKAMGDEELRQLIQNGRPGSAMPAWRYVLEDQALKSIVAYLKAIQGDSCE